MIIKINKALKNKHRNKIVKGSKVINFHDKKEASETQEILKDIQKIRLRRIEKIRNDIKKGVYNVRGEWVAEKVIMESIFCNALKKSNNS